MKKIIKIFFSILILIFITILSYPFLNKIEPIYNFKFNLVKGMLARVDHINIIDSWKHEDITLEDFGFRISTSKGKNLMINFYESNNWFEVFYKSDGLVLESSDSQTRYFITNATLVENKITAFNVKQVIDSIDRIENLFLEKKISENISDSENFIFIKLQNNL